MKWTARSAGATGNDEVGLMECSIGGEVTIGVFGLTIRPGMAKGTSSVSKPRSSSTSAPLRARIKQKGEPNRESVADSASRLIDQRIRELGGWRGEILARMRALIQEADPEVVEECKWRGTPVWSHAGIICTGEAYAKVVKLTFARGASLPDPSRLFNSSLEGNTRRAIDIHEGEAVDAKAFKALVKAAIAANTASSRGARSKATAPETPTGQAARAPEKTKRGETAESTKATRGTKRAPEKTKRGEVAESTKGKRSEMAESTKATRGTRRAPEKARRGEAAESAKGIRGATDVNPVKLLAGGNPQIAKGDGDAPVQAYLDALPGWKQDIGRWLDALITRTVRNVRKAVKWNSPFYGIEGRGWFLSFHAFTNYIKVTFFKGTSLQPMPPGPSKTEDTRYLDIREKDARDEAQLKAWLKQAAALPGWIP